MVTIIQSDIFDVQLDGIAHQTNAHGVHSAGFAKQLRMRYPRGQRADCCVLLHKKEKLGTFSFAAPDELQPVWIFNLCGQFDYGYNKQFTDYSALHKAMESCRDFIFKLNIKDFKLGMPYGLGAGLGGGNFDKILQIINYVFEKEPINVIICQKPS